MCAVGSWFSPYRKPPLNGYWHDSSPKNPASMGPPEWHLDSILAGGVHKETSEFGMNVLKILKSDHSAVRSLFNK
jgi:hypothetical protein